ncbi:hypothetical protein MG293_000094 [Ovis ammon polii]|uniref:Uncharacterized protein n=1 Tax=Ovis ammon polii TaxID=230172 RepID=A0AAD4YGV0_OVIAM|nr:hypothetical protein MG293_000094 [Ovis ammon polii]
MSLEELKSRCQQGLCLLEAPGVISAKSILPRKVMFTGSGDEDVDIFGDHYSAYTDTELDEIETCPQIIIIRGSRDRGAWWAAVYGVAQSSDLAAGAAKWEKAMHEPVKVAQISSKIKYQYNQFLYLVMRMMRKCPQVCYPLFRVEPDFLCTMNRALA